MGPDQKGESFVFSIISSISNTVIESMTILVMGFTHKQNSYQIGDPGTQSYQMGVCGRICVSNCFTSHSVLLIQTELLL